MYLEAVFDLVNMACLSPISIKVVKPLPLWKVEILGFQPKFIEVPCGKCLECQKRKANDLFFRMYADNKYLPSSYFVTLTYSDEFLPISSEFLEPCLVKSDLANFLKRVRKINKNLRFEYFACGEYGGETLRPHFHLIMMFENFLVPENVYNIVEKAWYRGCRIEIDPCEPACLNYCTKYLLKDMSLLNEGVLDVTFQFPPFSVWSKGLGLSYVTSINALFHYQQRNWQSKVNGRNYIVPEYLRKKFDKYLSKPQLDLIDKGQFIFALEHHNDVVNEYRFRYGDDMAFKRLAENQMFKQKCAYQRVIRTSKL